MTTFLLWFCLAGTCKQFSAGEYLTQGECERRKGMLEKTAKVLKERGQEIYTYECRQQSPPAK